MGAPSEALRAHAKAVNDLRNMLAAKPLEQFARGLLTVEDLIEQLTSVVIENPMKVCWCGDLATWQAAVDIMVTPPAATNAAGEPITFVCDAHLGETMWSVERIEA